MRTLLTVAVLVLTANPASAEVVAVPGLHGLGKMHHAKMSNEQTGHNYHIVIGLPRDYDDSLKYPTVYLLDGGALFPMLMGYSGYLQYAQDMPPSILVAVSYGTDDWQKGNRRSTDYTAPSEERDHWGGAEEFQRFLKQQVIPHIEENFAADPARRILFGQSIGGQFVLYTAQTDPDLFWGHIASNAALHRNLKFFLDTVPEHSGSESRLFVASADNDAPVFREPLKKWIDHWTSESDLPWKLKVSVLPGHNHFSVPPVSFRQGLIWLFE